MQQKMMRGSKLWARRHKERYLKSPAPPWAGRHKYNRRLANRRVRHDKSYKI